MWLICFRLNDANFYRQNLISGSQTADRVLIFVAYLISLMTSIAQKLQQIEALHRQIDARGELPPEVLRRLENRLREETNYYSNRQEGGTLTREETRSVMTGNITVAGKPLKDILEMQRHDQVTLDIFRIGKGELKLSEKRIKDIHRAILYEEDPVRQEQLGQWKTEANEIINSRGEKFAFTPPDEVPDAIHALLNWLNAGLEKVDRGKSDPGSVLLLAFEFHHRFLAIHPFHDGNGRTARLLSNLILVAYGYPPFFITDEEKGAYNRYLTEIQGYGASPEAFIDFMLGLVIRSLQLALDVIEGRDTDDWEKRLSLLMTQLPPEPLLQTVRSRETLLTWTEELVFPVLSKILPVLEKFDGLFIHRRMYFGTGSGAAEVHDLTGMQQFFGHNLHDSTGEVSFEVHFQGFNRAPGTPFDVRYKIKWLCQPYDYALYVPAESGTAQFNRPYSRGYTDEEIREIAAQVGAGLTDRIEKEVGKQT